MIFKNNLKCGLIRPQHTFPFCVCTFQKIAGPENAAVFLDVVDVCLLLCMVWILTCTCRCMQRTVLTDNGFLKCSWAHWVLMQCRLRDRSPQALNVGFRPCRLRVERSPDSLNLWIILWTVDDEINKFLAIDHWETLFLNCWTVLSCCSCAQSGYSKKLFFEYSSALPVFCCPCSIFFKRVTWIHVNMNKYLHKKFVKLNSNYLVLV